MKGEGGGMKTRIIDDVICEWSLIIIDTFNVLQQVNCRKYHGKDNLNKSILFPATGLQGL